MLWQSAAERLVIGCIAALTAGVIGASDPVPLGATIYWSLALAALCLATAFIVTSASRQHISPIRQFAMGIASGLLMSGAFIAGVSAADPGDPCRVEECFPLGDPLVAYLGVWILISLIVVPVGTISGILWLSLTRRLAP